MTMALRAIDAPVNYFDVGSITPAKPIALDDVSTVLSLDPDLVHHLNPPVQTPHHSRRKGKQNLHPWSCLWRPLTAFLRSSRFHR